MKGDVNAIPISITVTPIKMTMKKTIQIKDTTSKKNPQILYLYHMDRLHLTLLCL